MITIYIGLTNASKIQLAVLFSIGILLIAITIARVPLTLQDSMSQSSRSTVGIPVAIYWNEFMFLTGDSGPQSRSYVAA